MPWKETCPMKERSRFVVEQESGRYAMAELCRIFGISRETGYKWVERYKAEGPPGLQDRSRAPRCHPNAVPEEVEAVILETRAAYPTWGPKKLRAWLQTHRPEEGWPAGSTIGEILERHGLTVPRKKRRRTPPYTEPFAACAGPNAVWCMDFKGWFRTGDGVRCDPLTISDAFSRYVLRCQALSDMREERVRPLCEAAFREFGLPWAIRTDNGSPFASRGIAGLSRLSVWWLRLGIVPERIEAGHPEQNGRHERMHRTLKAETASPPAPTVRGQRRVRRPAAPLLLHISFAKLNNDPAPTPCHKKRPHLREKTAATLGSPRSNPHASSLTPQAVARGPFDSAQGMLGPANGARGASPRATNSITAVCGRGPGPGRPGPGAPASPARGSR